MTDDSSEDYLQDANLKNVQYIKERIAISNFRNFTYLIEVQIEGAKLLVQFKYIQAIRG